MAHDVIMPMLGMVQDTGTIVSWHKQPGDPVKASDVLMEVETDKATVEIEAGADGFVTAIRAEAGVPVPVGQVVAVISDNKDDVEAAPAPAAVEESKTEVAEPTAAEPPAAPAPTPTPQDAEKATAVATPQPRPRSRAASDRILASPKARRLAKERGIDLGRMVRLGIPEPIHVADLDKAGTTVGQALPSSMMRVTIARAPFEDFVDWVGEEAGADVEAINIWAAFAAGSLRVATDRNHNEEIVVEASHFDNTESPRFLKNPDRVPLSSIVAEPDDFAVTLTLLDLSGTMLTDYRRAEVSQLPFLTVCNSQDKANIDLYLEFDPAALPATTAYAFLKELADRTQVPLRHVL
jgi:pyruvate dehydrogenase E2 component (dihydrolipoamide acetyltransferase)/2-oxoglutarate dehydrogenase E2 component (dihydrolipoamide succinyltransferase)